MTDKNFVKVASAETQAAVAAAQEKILSGEVVVDSALAEGGADLAVELRDKVRP